MTKYAGQAPSTAGLTDDDTDMIDLYTRTYLPRRLVTRLCLLILSLLVGTPALASDSITAYDKIPQYAQFDNAYTAFSRDFVQHLARSGKYPHGLSIASLAQRARQLHKQRRPAEALALILANQSTIRNNINSKGTIEIAKLLLALNEFSTAKQVLTHVQNEADPSVVSNVQFAFANYYYARNNWHETTELVDKVVNDLPPADFQRAMLIQGVALQNLKHHRKALAVYARIPRTSPIYIAARINMAVANIRQDWWSDGYTILDALLQEDNINKNKELKDRLNTMIGYTFLQQAYYRNSREAFRRVALKGDYTNRALLGIALDAAYQKDYVGALNAARILRNQPGRALQIDEAHLLLPYFYEKLGQSATASAGYTDAIKYYESRLSTLNSALSQDTAYYLSARLDTERKILDIDGERLDLGEVLPEALFQQSALLLRYHDPVSTLAASGISAEYSQLQTRLATLLRDTSRELLKQKISYLTDYMNQCRYGLARLYDKNAVRKK